MGRRRGRHLSDEEQALWQAVKRTVRPIRPEPGAAPEPPPALAEEPPPAPAVRLPTAAVKAPPARPALDPLHPLGRRDRQALVRGRREIDGRLDLHGFRQDEAHARLAGFLAHGQASGWKVVLVITGKGSSGGEFSGLYGAERGVLRRMVPHWLSLPDFRRYVHGFEEAAAPHGGGGALYVRIRRRK